MNDDLSLLLNSLSDPQCQAVAAPLGRQLAFVGAGSDKIRVLMHRIVRLTQVEHVSPYSILSVISTNKVAAEICRRAEQLLGINPVGMWVGTFHGPAHRPPCAHWREVELSKNFQVLDSDDQQRLVRRVICGFGPNEQRWPAHQAQRFVNGQKDEGLRLQRIQPGSDLFLTAMLKIYETYETACAHAEVIDLSELLLCTLDPWRDHPGVPGYYQRHFRHILVDEFQDTDTVQCAWLQTLAEGDDSLMVVGDDDQSIYGRRGAWIENIQQFSDDFADAEVIRLKQNYRSTASILKVVSALIASSQGRLDKELRTDGEDGGSLSLYAAFNEHDEARCVVESIGSALRSGLARSGITILYCSNVQSRVLGEALLREKTLYHTYGGQRFFGRIEIKNAMTYLCLLDGRGNDAALEWAVNVPVRGIDEKTVESIHEFARGNDVSTWEAIRLMTANRVLSSRTASALTGFVELIENLSAEVMDMPLHLMTQTAIEQSRLISYHKERKGKKGQARAGNLEELISAVHAFENSEEEEDLTPLQAFLSHASLETRETQADAHGDSVQLMILHGVRGLELPLAFLVGMEEGLFPYKMNLEEPGRLEEERRLACVGVTRAMQRLVLTYAGTRRLHSSGAYDEVSCLIHKIPPSLIQEVCLSNTVSRPYGDTSRDAGGSLFGGVGVLGTPFSLGQRVHHALFDEGTILDFEGAGAQARVQVNFESEGGKRLTLGCARLEALQRYNPWRRPGGG